jgi:hypothetical protein
MLSKVLDKITSLRTKYLYEYSPHSSALADLPVDLFPYWQRTASLEFKGIPRDAFFFVRAAEGLMMFFDCVRRSGRPCGLPSKAADSVWHAWAELDPDHLARFNLRHFGRAIPHTEAAEMSIPMDAALAHCLVAARSLDGIPVAGPAVPKLFSLDRRLSMPNGFDYAAERGQVGHRRMTWQGTGTGERFFLDSLAPAMLLSAGLVSASDYDAYAQRMTANRDVGGCGSSCGAGGSSDSGGSSCGSSCGGGCGGGCGG